MRTIIRKDCSYDEFYAMRLEILQTVPFALINSEYLNYELIAVFILSDSDYIPKSWAEWIIKPSRKSE